MSISEGPKLDVQKRAKLHVKMKTAENKGNLICLQTERITAEAVGKARQQEERSGDTST